MTSSNSSDEAWTVPWWWLAGYAVAGVIVGLAMFGGGIQLSQWWLDGHTETVTTVACDDDYSYEEDGRTVERFQDESGTWCTRTTEHIDTYATTGWPLWLAGPAWLLAFAVLVVALAGGIVMAVVAVVSACDPDLRMEWESARRRRLAAKR